MTLQQLLGIELPIIQAPMAGVQDHRLAVAVSNAGGLGSLPAAMLSLEALRSELTALQAQTGKPYNVNFFCHTPPTPDATREAAWRAALAPYYAELDLDPAQIPAGPGRAPFSAEAAALLAEFRPPVVSFHFGLPSARAVQELKKIGAKLIGNATNVAEAKVLEAAGMDAIVAQGAEAGGHRGAFIGAAHENDMGTMALTPLVVDAVSVPVIAAGGIFDGRGVAAAMMLGASGAQIGSAFLRTPESSALALHKQALAETADNSTKLTRLFSGRPARSIRNRLVRELAEHEGDAAPFPTQRAVIAPLTKAAAAKGSADFMQLWSGQAGLRAEAAPSAQIFRRICDEALALLR